MKTIRKGVFETNSSSTHSIHISDNTDYDSIEPNEEGNITIECGEYGWKVDSYHNVMSRISYSATHALSEINDENIKNSDEKIELDKFNDQKVKMLSDVLKKHTGANKIFVRVLDDYYPFGSIDHQSYDVAESAFKDEETLKQFLFSKNSYFETDNDNH